MVSGVFRLGKALRVCEGVQLLLQSTYKNNDSMFEMDAIVVAATKSTSIRRRDGDREAHNAAELMMGDSLITIIFHYGGSSVTERDGSVNYSCGQISELLRIDVDTLDVFFVRDYYKRIGYDNVTHCWWLVPNRPLQSSLRAVTHDKELMEICYLAQKNKKIVHVYYEHGVSELVFDEKTELASSKGKELIVIQDPIPHSYPTINATANIIFTTSLSTPIPEPTHTTSPKTIPTTSPPIPILESIHTTIPTPTTISTTKPAGKASHARRPLTRSAATGTFERASIKEKEPKTVFVSLSSEEESSDSHDSYDSVENEPYRLAGDDVSSEEEEVIVVSVKGKEPETVFVIVYC
ncbi:hypothetical protein Ahy_B02g058392 [Arachis hypogaea]|uniref:PB1-like domain-containing protein n=1 Tax=Arachis hypogaea TaxID=3818 RepID=A0A445AEK3_ARAHY|nr:hypothetical protein Ahy_B02g058392 [Arachis hypogaea]